MDVNINYAVRFKNPVFIVTFLTAVVTFVYQILGMLGIIPTISQNEIINIITLIVNMLTMMGILVDPTTKGLSDSTQAMFYDEPA